MLSLIKYEDRLLKPVFFCTPKYVVTAPMRA